jgi:hypothetical protein
MLINNNIRKSLKIYLNFIHCWLIGTMSQKIRLWL